SAGDPRGRAGGGCRTVRGGPVRRPVPAGRGDGDDGSGTDDQRGAAGGRRVLVLPRPGSDRAGSAAGGAGGDDGGDGHGLRGGHAAAPTGTDGHDRHGRGPVPMTGPQTVLLAMVALPATVGGVLALARPRRGAAPIALVTSGLTTVLA